MKLTCSFIGCFLLLLYGCETCDPSISLGELPLTENSRAFIPYTDNDTLVFLDDQGAEHLLTCPKGWQSLENQMIVRTLCENWPSAPQFEYYDVETVNLVFTDSSNNSISIGLYTHFEDDTNVDSIAIFDWFEVVFSSPQEDIAGMSIMTDERKNKVSDSFLALGYNSSQFLGDTTLYGKAFIDVFADDANSGFGIFYNKEKGVVAINFSGGKYWVLK